MNNLRVSLTRWWSREKGIVLPLALLAVLLGYDQGRKYWLDTQFANPAAVDTTVATVRERTYFKNDFKYEVEFRAGSGLTSARLRSLDHTFAVGERVRIVYLKDDWEEVRVLGE